MIMIGDKCYIIVRNFDCEYCKYVNRVRFGRHDFDHLLCKINSGGNNCPFIIKEQEIEMYMVSKDDNGKEVASVLTYSQSGEYYEELVGWNERCYLDKGEAERDLKILNENHERLHYTRKED